MVKKQGVPQAQRNSEIQTQDHKKVTQILNSTSVAVKVRHPEVARLIDCDFRIMRCLGSFLDAIPSLRWLNIGTSIEQFSHTLAAQAHLNVEAHHLEILNDNFRSWPTVGFPKPIFATGSVIIETFEKGQIVTSLLNKYNLGTSKNLEKHTEDIPPDLMKFIVTKGTALYLKMLLVDNLMHAG